MKFEKWQALGNDYLIVEVASLSFELTPERIQRICDPHFGVGSDGILLLLPHEDPAYVAELRIFNPDGSEAELSGNGAREAVLYLRRSGWTEDNTFSIITRAGPITPILTSERTATIEMGRARTTSDDYPGGEADGKGTLSAAGRNWMFQHVSIGNPQCAIEVAGLEELHDLDLGWVGPEIEGSDLFANRTNVSFYCSTGTGKIRARIFERGVGETLSSGTGASGAAVAAVLGGSNSPVTVLLDGGELEVEVSPELDVRLTGWAEPVARGELSAELIAALEAL